MTTREEKIEVILQAVASGISASKIEPSRKGATVGKLRKNRNAAMGDNKLNEMYENAKSLLAGQSQGKTQRTGQRENIGSDSELKTPTTHKQATNGIAELLKRMDDLEAQVHALSEENQALKERLAGLDSSVDSRLSTMESKIDSRVDSQNVIGFSLAKRKTGGTVEYWYAGKKISGKMHWIYIGKDAANAEEKIKAWLQERPELAGKLEGYGQG